MLNEWNRKLTGVRWSLLFAFFRAIAAALAVFIGLVWGAVAIWNEVSDTPLFVDMGTWTVGQWLPAVVIFLLAALISILLVATTIGSFEARTLRWRMHTLIEATTLWANGRLGHRIVITGVDDEVGELATSLNGMAGRLEEHVAALQRLVEKNERLYQQAAGLAAMEERARLARDLHDSVSQQLFALGMTIGAANKLASQPERARPLIEQAEKMASKAQAEMRALLMHLRPVELEGRSLIEALERFLQDVCPRHQMSYDLEAEGISGLGEGLESQLFRVVQEAVSNVIRHASASLLQVRLVQDGTRVVLSIRDDGQGFEPGLVRDGSYGMQSIRERAEEIGGRLEVRSAIGAGTEVRVTVRMIG